MKSLFAVFFALASVSAQAQTDTVLKKYALVYTPGPAWDTTKTPDKQPYFDTHSKFLSAMRREKKILFGGRFSDKGLIIIQAMNDAEMESLLKTDLTIANKVFTASFYRLSVFYDGCISR